MGRNYSGCSINHTLGTLRRVLRRAQRWCKRSGYKVYVPDFSETRMQETLHERVVKADEKALYAEKCSRRHWVFFKLLINTGMEPGYAAAAQWGTSNRHPQPDICCSEPLWQLPPKNKRPGSRNPRPLSFFGGRALESFPARKQLTRGSANAGLTPPANFPTIFHTVHFWCNVAKSLRSFFSKRGRRDSNSRPPA